MEFNKSVVLKNQFKSIAETKGKAKQGVIKNFAEGEDGFVFKEALYFVFNPFIVTGIAKKKIEQDLGALPDLHPEPIEKMLYFVKNRNTGSNETVKAVQSWILAQPAETHEFFQQVFSKDIQIGVSAKTINKVLGENFIPIFEPMLAKKYADRAHKITGDFAITLKLNGTRALAFNGNDGVKIFTRKGQPITGCYEVEEEIAKLPKGFIYDGELCNELVEGMSDHDLFRLGNGKLRRDGEKTGIRFVLFDLITFEDWDNGKSEEVYKYRFDELIGFYADVEKTNIIELVERYYIGSDHEVIPDLLDKVMDLGLEGLMLNDLNAKYVKGRPDGLLKIKKMEEGDFQIVGYEEHKHGDKLGSFIVDFKGNEVHVGTGIKHHEQEEFWEKRDEMIGKIIEVHYQAESQNDKGEPSLQFPAFKGVRWDKDEPNY